MSCSPSRCQRLTFLLQRQINGLQFGGYGGACVGAAVQRTQKQDGWRVGCQWLKELPLRLNVAEVLPRGRNGLTVPGRKASLVPSIQAALAVFAAADD